MKRIEHYRNNDTTAYRTSRNETLKRMVTFLTAVVFVFGCSCIPAGKTAEEVYAANDGVRYVDGEVIVCYIDTDDMNLTAGQEKRAEKLLGDAEEIATLENVSLADVSIDESKLTKKIRRAEEVDKALAVISDDDKSTDELIRDIEKLPNVDYVEPNYIFSLCGGERNVDTEEPAAYKGETAETTGAGAAEQEERSPDENSGAAEEAAESEDGFEDELNVSDYSQWQWAYTDMELGLNIPDWNVQGNNNAEGTVVAILDSGVDYMHEDLDDVMWSDGSSYGYNACDAKKINDPMDDNGHGTHCAGIVAAEWNGQGVSGAANGTKIMAVKAADRWGYLSYKSILKGYKYIIDRKTKGTNIVAINNSWGGPAASDNGLNNIVTLAGQHGMVSVFASGNGDYYGIGQDCDSVKYICSFLQDNPYAVVVNSIESSGGLSPFSNYGARSTDLAAPGSDILSTVKDNQYGEMSGTSMAAPAVSGEAAILAAEFTDEPADFISSVIVNNTRNKGFLSGKCVSGGIADVTKALAADPREIRNRNFRLSAGEFSYDGTEKKPEVIVSKLKEGEDYEVLYQEDSRSAGTHKVTVRALGQHYAGFIELEYKIKKANPQVSLRSSSYTYDGGSKSNEVYVKGADGKSWSNGVQYSLSGTLTAKLPGTYKLTVTPADSHNYNTVVKAYSISVKPTSISKLSKAKKGFTVRVAKQSKKHVSGYQLRYSLKSNMSGAVTKTVGTKYNKTSKKVRSLKKKTKYYVQVRSYRIISGEKHYSSWSGTRTVRTR
ncbi:MAG: S8 family serine peptidase [Bacillota bacterium]|nr:S8 family serine peptidase [Bacillota bacterium]